MRKLDDHLQVHWPDNLRLTLQMYQDQWLRMCLTLTLSYVTDRCLYKSSTTNASACEGYQIVYGKYQYQ